MYVTERQKFRHDLEPSPPVDSGAPNSWPSADRRPPAVDRRPPAVDRWPSTADRQLSTAARRPPAPSTAARRPLRLPLSQPVAMQPPAASPPAASRLLLALFGTPRCYAKNFWRPAICKVEVIWSTTSADQG